MAVTLLLYLYRPELWFWNSVVLILTLALAASQVFATALDAYFQLTIMLMILMLGVIAFAHFRPFVDDLLQRMQVRILTFCFSPVLSIPPLTLPSPLLLLHSH